MALPLSGSITANMINVELGNSGNKPFSIDQAEVRALAGLPTGPIKFSDIHGKSAKPADTITYDLSTGMTVKFDRSRYVEASAKLTPPAISDTVPEYSASSIPELAAYADPAVRVLFTDIKMSVNIHATSSAIRVLEFSTFFRPVPAGAVTKTIRSPKVEITFEFAGGASFTFKTDRIYLYGTGLIKYKLAIPNNTYEALAVSEFKRLYALSSSVKTGNVPFKVTIKFT